MFAAAQLDSLSEDKKLWGDALGCLGELILNEKFKDIFLSFCDKNSTECIPIAFRDKKVKSPENYFLINPLSEIEIMDEKIANASLDLLINSSKLEKITNMPDVFRVKYMKYPIVVSETVVNELKKHHITNLEFEEVTQS